MELCNRLISSDCDVTHVKVVVTQVLSSFREQSGSDYERYIRTVIGVDMLCLMDAEDQVIKMCFHEIIYSYYLHAQYDSC